VIALAATACTPVSRQDASRAEDECRAEARDMGYRKISVTTGAIGIGDVIDYGLSARRHGNDYTGTCVYDKDSRRAEVSFDEATADGDNGFAHAREVCTDEADLRGYRVRDVSNEKVRNHVVRMNLDLRRNDRNYVGVCRFEDGHADLDIDRD
jgi:hypothetical protein